MADKDTKKTTGTKSEKTKAKSEKTGTKSEKKETTSDGGESTQNDSGGDPGRDYSRGEGQKPTSKAYRDNWSDIFSKKKRK